LVAKRSRAVPSEGASTTLPLTSTFQPWKMHVSAQSSLRASNSDARRCGQPSSSKPTRPSCARNAA
jgi:hypothetical protein